ncbi:MAG: hypothetical protein AAF734_05430, partial [Bacteroidota bacterium]
MNAIEFFFPKHLLADTDDYRKARILIASLIIATSFSTVYALIYYSMQYYWGTAILSVTILSLIILLLVFKRSVSFLVVGNFFTLSAYYTMISLTYTNIAITTPLWLVLCPIFAFLYASKISGYLWSIFTFATVAMLHLLRINGYEFSLQHDPALITYNEMANSLGILVFIIMIVMIYESEKDKLLVRLN